MFWQQSDDVPKKDLKIMSHFPAFSPSYEHSRLSKLISKFSMPENLQFGFLPPKNPSWGMLHLQGKRCLGGLGAIAASVWVILGKAI